MYDIKVIIIIIIIMIIIKNMHIFSIHVLAQTPTNSNLDTQRLHTQVRVL